MALPVKTTLTVFFDRRPALIARPSQSFELLRDQSSVLSLASFCFQSVGCWRGARCPTRASRRKGQRVGVDVVAAQVRGADLPLLGKPPVGDVSGDLVPELAGEVEAAFQRLVSCRPAIRILRGVVDAAEGE